MSRKMYFLTGLLALTLAAVALLVDALVTTEEERIDAFVDAVTGDVEIERIDRALAYTDPAREPLEVAVDGSSTHYGEGDDAYLAENAHNILAPFLGRGVSVLQKHVAIEEERAQVNLRLLTSQGYVNVEFKLNRHRDGWLVQRVRVS